MPDNQHYVKFTHLPRALPLSATASALFPRPIPKNGPPDKHTTPRKFLRYFRLFPLPIFLFCRIVLLGEVKVGKLSYIWQPEWLGTPYKRYANVAWELRRYGRLLRAKRRKELDRILGMWGELPRSRRYLLKRDVYRWKRHVWTHRWLGWWDV